MNRRLITIFLLIISISIPTMVSAADVTEAIPADSLGYVVVGDITNADSKISEVAKLMQLPAPSVLALAKLSAGVKDGLDDKGSLAIALVFNDDEASPVAPLIILPAKDYATLVKQFGAEDPTAKISEIQINGAKSLVGEKKGYAVISPPQFKDSLTAALDAKKSISDSVKPLAKFLDSGDLGVVVTPSGIKLGTTKVLEGLAMVKLLLAANEETKSAVAGLVLYENMFQYIQDKVTHIGVALQVEMNGTCHLATRTIFKSDMQDPLETPMLTEERGSLKSLPDVPFVTAVHGNFGQGLSEAFIKMSAEMMKSYPGGEGLTDKHIKKIAQLSYESMSGVKSLSFLVGVSEKDEPLYSNMVFALKVDDSKDYLKRYEEVLNEMRKIGEDAELPIYQFEKPKHVEADGVKALELTMDISAFSGLEDPAFKDIMAKMFGADGKMRFYLTAIDAHTVAGAYVSTKSLKSVVDAVKKQKANLTANKEVSATAAMLPSNPDWVVYVSPEGSVKFVNRMIKTVLPPELGIAVPDFPKSPPVGFGVKSKLSQTDTDLVIPAATLKAIGDYIKQVNGGG